MTTKPMGQEQELTSTEEQASPVTAEVTGEEKPSTEEERTSDVVAWNETDEAKAEFQRIEDESYRRGQGDRDRQVSQAQERARSESAATIREQRALASAYEAQLREYGEDDSFFELAGHRSKVEGAKAPPLDTRKMLEGIVNQNTKAIFELAEKHGVKLLDDDNDMLPDIDFSMERYKKDPIAEAHRLTDTIITRAVKAATSELKAEHKAALEAQATTYEEKLRQTQRVDTGEPGGASTGRFFTNAQVRAMSPQEFASHHFTNEEIVAMQKRK